MCIYTEAWHVIGLWVAPSLTQLPLCSHIAMFKSKPLYCSQWMCVVWRRCTSESQIWMQTCVNAVSVCLNAAQVLLNCVKKMFSCSSRVLVTIYRMYIMIMCSAQRNKGVKRRKKKNAFMWIYYVVFLVTRGQKRSTTRSHEIHKPWENLKYE